MSELGIGDEKFGPDDADTGAEWADTSDAVTDDKSKPNGGLDSTKGFPVVVIKGFEDRVGGKSELLDVVAQWATSLVENKVNKSRPSFPRIGQQTLRPDRTCDRVERQQRKCQTTRKRYSSRC